ncbi:hypothetical protein HC891_15715 [Candidatus Gracilibacteria bacterium]|nr:hypothetical protein [Candidatus Gracilibacteria bacterium]
MKAHTTKTERKDQGFPNEIMRGRALIGTTGYSSIYSADGPFARLHVIDIRNPDQLQDYPQYPPFMVDYYVEQLAVYGHALFVVEERRFTVLERLLPYKLQLPLVSASQGDR